MVLTYAWLSHISYTEKAFISSTATITESTMFVAVPVMDIGEVWVLVLHAVMIMRMGMLPGKAVGMFVAVMAVIMRMHMVVLQAGVDMQVSVPLPKDQCGSCEQEWQGEVKLQRRDLTEYQDGDQCTDEWRRAKEGTGPGGAHAPHGQDEKDDADAIAQCTQQQRVYHIQQRGKRASGYKREDQGDEARPEAFDDGNNERVFG